MQLFKPSDFGLSDTKENVGNKLFDKSLYNPSDFGLSSTSKNQSIPLNNQLFTTTNFGQEQSNSIADQIKQFTNSVKNQADTVSNDILPGINNNPWKATITGTKIGLVIGLVIGIGYSYKSKAPVLNSIGNALLGSLSVGGLGSGVGLLIDSLKHKDKQ